MKRWSLVVAIVAVFVLALTLPTGAPAAPPSHNALPAAAGAPHAKAAAAANPEPHPEIRAAIGSLRNAREHLEHADHDFGGHRVDAVHAIDQAIEQLQICLKYDRR
jgi:hypothetical protein